MIEIVQVDAFTDRPFAGNPAAVCMLDQPADEAWMQAVANEMNLSETAFLLAVDDGFDLRWFTPEVEVDLCGHATLASAHALWSEGHLSGDETARFHTRSGLLTAQRTGDGWIEMDFPARPPRPAEAPPGLVDALGTEPEFLGRNVDDYLVLISSASTLREMAPDLGLLGTVKSRGVIVTSASDTPQFDFLSRFFAPGAGVPEDPVTGSAHCCLCPFWSERLGKNEMTAYQASRRGGTIRVVQRGERVLLRGQAVTVLHAALQD